MVEEENKNKKKNDGDEIINLLKEFYRPDEELEGFSDFYSSIETKLEEQNPVNKINQNSNNIENAYFLRQERLNKFIQRLESGEFDAEKIRASKIGKRKSKKIKSKVLIASLLLLLALGGIASFKTKNKYKFISPSDSKIDWTKINLTESQRNKLNEISKSYDEIFSREVKLIDTKKLALEQEINKLKPDLVLIDQYQRQILDHEVTLKREKLNNFLEKRFILNESQSLALLRELKDN